MFQVFARSAFTAEIIDRVDVSAASWERLLSAGGSGGVSLPLDGSYSRSQLRQLTEHWSVIYEVAYDDKPLFMGYVTDHGYKHETGMLDVKLGDLWALLARRGAWDHGVPHIEKWSVTENVSLAQHAANAVMRGRDTGPALPAMWFPVTIPGFGGAKVSRTTYGYHAERVGDSLTRFMDEGLDVYFRPRRGLNDRADWLMEAGPSWRSGRTHEYHVTVPFSRLTGFAEQSDGKRITNNARRIGEGSEQDMLVRSERNTASPYPLLDRVTAAKHIKNVNELAAQAHADLDLYGFPTIQWDFQVPIEDGVDVGDTVRLYFYGDPWITDGWHERRVVKVSGGLESFVTVSCQPTGGA